MTLDVVLIAAVGRDMAIGKDGRIPWRLPGDMRRFRQLTMGHPVVMGRRTWDSLPNGALPGRLNIVVSRQPTLRQGALHALSTRDALLLAEGSGASRAYVVGGQAIYREAMPVANGMELTLVDVDTPDHDASFPGWDPGDWEVTQDVQGDGVPGHRFTTYRRRT